jgi:hypothetical protein
MKFLSQLSRAGGVKLLLGGLVVSLLIGGSSKFSTPVRASDHDDGETNIKTKNTNLTDLYVFRQDWETGSTADANKLVFIMNTNPRSLPRQQYFFNTNAFYNFSVTRNPGNTNAAGSGANATVTGREDVRLAFNFGPPSAAGTQSISLTVSQFTNGNTTASNTQVLSNVGTTTAAAPLIGTSPAPAPVSNTINVGPIANTNGGQVTVFAGLREDPFFFDVEAFFRTRALLAGATGPTGSTFLSTTTATAQDFTKGYNVNAIVMSIPINLLQTSAGETCFDVWETITIPSTTAALGLPL